MKIESIRIENFRSFKDQTITFDDYNIKDKYKFFSLVDVLKLNQGI